MSDLIELALAVAIIMELVLVVWCARATFRFVAYHVQERLIFRKGDWVRAERWRERFGFAVPPITSDVHAMAIAEYSGATSLALERAERMLLAYRHMVIVAQCVPTLVNGGRYTRALEVAEPCQEPQPLLERGIWALLQVNVAEAEYNLGLWDEALARLDRLHVGWIPPAIVQTGGHQQKAWILAHLGKVAEARTAMTRAALRDLPPIFHAEYHYTLAHIAMAEGDIANALGCVERGRALARRAASRRNGLFMRATTLAARGDTDAALADFETAAAMPYRGQGGSGLLAWGDLLRSLGREEEARRVFTLVQERDPESESARVAGSRMEEVA